MKIYISHSSNYDFEDELYSPIKGSPFYKDHHFYFPHDEKNTGVDARPTIKDANLIIAEVSRPSTGQGIELGWASTKNIPILCVYSSGASISSSLDFITNNFLEYMGKEDMIRKIETWLSVAH